jgi:two-component system, OmpR family, KDP operon response regulator KdpE
VSVAARVLVVDDEPQIVRGLSASLRAAGYEVASAESAHEALEAAALRPPDAVILDLALPDGSGVEVCRSLREWTDAPVIVVSALDAEGDKIAALDAGADDYVTKPYAVGELLARLRAALRRGATPAGTIPTVVFGDVSVDLSRRDVTRSGAPVHLTPREYELLAELARYAGRVLTHASLLRTLWGPTFVGETHYLRVQMASLRQKLEPEPARPRFLLTETGVGYRLRLEPRTSEEFS